MTRKEKAEDLYRLMLTLPTTYKDVKNQLETGRNYGFPLMTIKDVNDNWRLWFDSWIVPRILELVPELKEYKDAPIYQNR